MRICVTGASGKVGRATVEDLRAHGYEVTAVDLVTVREHSGPTVVGADLTDATQAAEVLAGMDAVVHIANHPAPDELQHAERGRERRSVTGRMGFQ
jgi:nucleoside-diphosphate-sugar epimerase